MDLTPTQIILLIILPFVAGVALLTKSGYSWYKEREQRRQLQSAMQHEETRRQALFKDTFELRQFDEEWRRTKGHQQQACIFAGTFAARNLVQFATAFERASAGDHLGPILLLELSEDERDRCMRNLPAYIRERIVPAQSELCPEGLTGARLAQAIERQEEWWHDVETAIRRWIALLQHDARTACCIAMVSPGGSAILAYPALSIFREHYKFAPCCLSTIIDHKPEVRFRFPEVRQLLCQDGLVTGTIVGMNSRDSKRYDIGNTLFYASAVNAPWIDDHPSSLPNLGAHLFPRECHCGASAHRYATLSVYPDNFPVYFEPAWENVLPEVYYTKASMAVSAMQRCIRAVLERPALQSVPLEPVATDHSREIYISAPINPTHLQVIADQVRDNMQGYLAKKDPYVNLHFSSIGVPLTPTDIQAPVIAVMVQALEDTGEGLDALALEKHTIADKFIMHDLRDIPVPPTKKAQLPAPDANE